MKWLETPDYRAITPIYQQIKDAVVRAIENGTLTEGDQMPSIHKIRQEFNLAPGTVIRAYEELKELGVLSSKQGKGFFIASSGIQNKLKVFLLFDRMNAYKEIIYESFMEHTGRDA